MLPFGVTIPATVEVGNPRGTYELPRVVQPDRPQMKVRRVRMSTGYLIFRWAIPVDWPNFDLFFTYDIVQIVQFPQQRNLRPDDGLIKKGRNM